MGMATAPVACNLTMLLIPLRIGRYCDLRVCASLAVSPQLAANFGDLRTELSAQACRRHTLPDESTPVLCEKKLGCVEPPFLNNSEAQWFAGD